MEFSNNVSVSEAARLTGWAERTVQKYAQMGTLEVETIDDGIGGNAGKSYRIPLSALPPEAQIRYYEDLGRREFSMPGAEEFDFGAYRTAHGEEGVRLLLARQRAVLQLIGMKAARMHGLTEASERIAQENGMSGATLRRFTERYEKEGLAGLVRRGRDDKGEFRSMCLEARRLICEYDLDYHKLKANTIIDIVRDRARELGPRGCDECPYNHESANYAALELAGEDQWYPACADKGNGILPPANRHAVNRVIAQISPEERCYMRQGRKAWEAAYMTKAVRKKPDIVNDVWFGDHHQFDVFVVGPKGTPVRPWLTIWYDIGSGYPVGWCISLNPNSETITEAFLSAVRKNGNDPIYGAPNTIYIDNGKDYRSKAFEGDAEAEYWRSRDPELASEMYMQLVGASVLQAMHVKVVHAQAYHGWAKPVERFFRTLEERYCRQLIGYCGGKPGDRAENFERMLKEWMQRGELLALDEFAAIFANKIIPAYANHPHEGYNGETPAARYARLPKARREVFAPAMLTELRKKEERRKISPMGIKFRNRLYWDPELMHRVGEVVAIKYTDAVIEEITIRDLDGHYICDAHEREGFQYVGEDPGIVAQHVETQKHQENSIQQRIAARGVRLPGKRASGNMYLPAYDEQEASTGNITHIGAEQAARKRRKQAEPEWDDVDEMLRRRFFEKLQQG